MIRTEYTVARAFGVPIKVDLSLLVLALVLVWHAGSLAIGLLAAGLLLVSVTLHELGHTWMALQFGCRVRDITLLLLGGRATLLDMPREPWKEFLVALAGPFVSLLLWVGGWACGRWLIAGSEILPAAGTPLVIGGAVVFWLGLINKYLLLFNLLPAFPMDGGRVLRAILSQRVGRLRGTYIASRIGRLLAIGMGAFAVYESRWMLLLIAVFVYQAAEQEYRLVQMEETRGFDPFRVFWTPEPPPVPQDEVRVSPPPYERGRDRRSDLHVER
jgi:Zn-dependent protease